MARETKAIKPRKPKPACFRVKSGRALSVAVAGSFNGWNPTGLRRLADDVWELDMDLAPGYHEYLFIVDGQWMPDAANAMTVPNPFGGVNSVMVIE